MSKQILSYPIARGIAAKEWRDLFPDECAALSHLEEDGRMMIELAKEEMQKPVDADDCGFSYLFIGGRMLAGMRQGEKERKDRDKWIEIRADFLVRKSMN